MDQQELTRALTAKDTSSVVGLLIDLHTELDSHTIAEETGQDLDTTQEHDFNYSGCLDQLTSIYDTYTKEETTTNKKKATTADEGDTDPDLQAESSIALSKILSRDFVLTFHHLPTKVYDFANLLLGKLAVNNDELLDPHAQVAVILLIDLFESFPTSLGSLISFAVSQIYKIIKKLPHTASHSIVYLLATITENATKFDIDDKLQQKLLKLVSKAVVSVPILTQQRDDAESSTHTVSTTVLSKRNYVLVLKNLLILTVSTHYEGLLALSASLLGAGLKLKPEQIMVQQHTFQTSLLTQYEKVITFGLTNFVQEIRLATVELLAHLFVNFIPTGKFLAMEYLVKEYKFPELNDWDLSTNRERDEFSESSDNTSVSNGGVTSRAFNSVASHDSTAIINVSTTQLLHQISISETIVLYVQLEQFQNLDYLSNNLISHLDLILTKFGELNVAINHIQNQHWSKVLAQWTKLVGFMIRECGSSSHEMLLSYISEKFNGKNGLGQGAGSSEQPNFLSKDKRRESGLFSFKSGKLHQKKQARELKIKEINPFTNPYQCYFLLKILDKLLPLGINFTSMNKEESTITEDEEDGRSGSSTEEPFIRDILFKLILNNNQYIRNYALKTFLVYAANNEVEVNQLILKTFNLINAEFKSTSSTTTFVNNSNENMSSSLKVRLISYSLTLLSFLKQANYTDLQTSTIVKILSFCTQNLKLNNHSSNSHLKNSSCWIILTALVTMYNDSDFVKLNSSSFLVFWKSLLTTQYISTNTSGENEEVDVINNLQLRNFSLVCLLNYLNTADMTPEALKQFQLLLAKSYNYLTHLENIYELVGAVTNFNNQRFNENDYNVNLLNNIQYGDDCDVLLSEKQLISLILYNKKILFQLYTKIAGMLKNDINSNMVIFLLKIFSDSKIFCRTSSTSEIAKEKLKSSKNKSGKDILNDYDESAILLQEDYNYSFGVTSKWIPSTSEVDELKVKHSESQSVTTLRESNTSFLYQDPFGTTGEWFKSFEDLVYQNTDNSINYDTSAFVLQEYSQHQQYSTNLTTSLVDLSIELFQIVFPFLAHKIQMSLLEQMRNSLTGSGSIDPLRLKAVGINISIVAYGLAHGNHKKALDKDIVAVLLDILSKVQTKNKQLMELNCQSVGAFAKSSDPATVNILINKFIADIVGDTDPYKRGQSILSLAHIYQNTDLEFGEIFNVTQQLLADPNPIVYYYSLQTMQVLFEKNLENLHLIAEVLGKVYDNFLNNNFGYDISSKILINSKCQYSGVGQLSALLRLFVTILGPNLREESSGVRLQLKNLLILLRVGVGCVTNQDSFLVNKNLLLLFQELVIFDPTLIEEEVQFITRYVVLVILKNVKVGLSCTSATSQQRELLFPFNSSFELYKLAYVCFAELIKIHGPEKILSKSAVNLLWISMNMKPCEELKELIRFWLGSSNYDAHWFNTLSSIFKISSKKLVAPFIEVNYQQKLLPLLQRQKKKAAGVSKAVIFRDEEIENIVSEDATSSDKNEPITWEFKLFIFELLNELLLAASRNDQLLQHLKLKIQDIVNISFLGSTSPISEIKLQGVKLLDKALLVFGDIPDPLYPGVSILEQQQAQIISALMPCFSPDSGASIIVETINISSKFINLPRIKFYSKQRILKTLIDLLEELSSNKFLRFDYLENMSEFNKKSIQLSILNCWAILKIDEDILGNAAETELTETLDKYSDLLTSLWILVLREYSTIKFNESSSSEKEIANYSNYWINFISVLSLELGKNDHFIRDTLGDDAGNFFFILFSQCVESLVKNKNVTEILVSMNRLVKSQDLIVYIFNDEIFGELVDLFDRLILIDEDPEIKSQVIEIVNGMFNTYFDIQSDLTEGLDKLFELIRVSMLPLFNILPILKSDYDPENKESQYALKHADSAPNLLMLKKCFSSVVEMMSRFPDLVKVDLYSCLLFMFAKVYEYGNPLLILTVLLHLKQVLGESKNFANVDLVTPFSGLIQSHYQISADNVNSVLTSMVLITTGDVQILKENSQRLGDALVELLANANSATMAVHCIKTLIQYSGTQVQLPVVRFLIKAMVEVLVEGTSEIDNKVAMEILLVFAKSKHEEDGVQIYSLLVPLLLKLGDGGELDSTYVRGKVTSLVELNATAFKVVLNDVLTTEQRAQIEDLVKGRPGAVNQSLPDEQPEIQLKTFGEK